MTRTARTRLRELAAKYKRCGRESLRLGEGPILCNAVLPLLDEVERLRELVQEGYELSRYAASIHWSESETNTREWLDEFGGMIEKFQPKAEAALRGEEPAK